MKKFLTVFCSTLILGTYVVYAADCNVSVQTYTTNTSLNELVAQNYYSNKVNSNILYNKPVIETTTSKLCNIAIETSTQKPCNSTTETTTQLTTSKPNIETTTETTTQLTTSKPNIETTTETTTQLTTSKPNIETTTETTTQLTTSKPNIETTTETTTQLTTSKPNIETTTETTTQLTTSKPNIETSTETTTSSSSSSNQSSIANQVLNLVNSARAKENLAPLKLNLALSNVAQAKSEDMQKNNYFEHTSPTYGSPFDMIKKFGISYSSAGENIAKGQKTAEAVVNAWLNSEGHRANILNKNFTDMGLGYVNTGGTTYWTQMFIRQ